MATHMMDGREVTMPEALAAARPVRLETIWAPVPRRTIVERLIAAGKATAWTSALAADPTARMLWEASAAIAPDDARVVAMLTAIGADPAAILA